MICKNAQKSRKNHSHRVNRELKYS